MAWVQKGEPMFNKFAIILFTTIFLAGCASTKITGYTDPAFSTTAYSNTTVLATGFGFERGAGLETRICDQFQSRGIDCTSFMSLFPPTRQYTGSEIFGALEEHNIESAIVISPRGDQSASNIFGYQSSGNATVYGNSVYGSSSTYALRSYSRQSRIRIRLFDVDSRQTAWLGDANTEGKGLLNVTDEAFDSSLASEVVSTLSEIGRF